MRRTFWRLVAVAVTVYQTISVAYFVAHFERVSFLLHLLGLACCIWALIAMDREGAPVDDDSQ